jgi:hypothetical protein
MLCQLCDSQAEILVTSGTTVERVTCSVCGEYEIADSILKPIAKGHDWPHRRATLSRAARRLFDFGTVLTLRTEDQALEAIREQILAEDDQKPEAG